MPDPRSRFLFLLNASVSSGGFRKLTLGKYRGTDSSVRNLYIRPVSLKSGPHLSFVWRHATRDITKNLRANEALEAITSLLGTDFLDAHLFSADVVAHFASGAKANTPDSLSISQAPRCDSDANEKSASDSHDRTKAHLINPLSPWLHTLGITNEHGQPRSEMSAKFRQIQNFASLFQHLYAEAWPTPPETPCRIVDMGCGKGYLTFAIASLLGANATVRGIERRPDLVVKCNTAARQHNLDHLSFIEGDIANTDHGSIDALIALHACDTATDEALARGIATGAKLLVVAPCCQKELRPQLKAPAVLAPSLRHGIFMERQAEFVTDALRALLLEWAGYDTRVFEFISTEHTAKNLMIAAIRKRPSGSEEAAQRVKNLASLYGISSQRLASLLSFPLSTLSA